jgi:hypothetical protein
MAQHTGTVRVRPAETERRMWFPLAPAAPDSLPLPSLHEISRWQGPWSCRQLDAALAVDAAGRLATTLAGARESQRLRIVPPARAGEARGEARAAEGGQDRLRGGPVTCGLWLARRRLVAAMVGAEGEARRVIRAALTDDARFGLVEYLAATGTTELVATVALARVELLPAQAARRGLVVWTVSDSFAAALLGAAAIRDPARAATLLARLPVIPLLRASLRRLAPPDTRQLPLL